MRPIDRILGRTADERPSYAVRPFGTTPADAAAADAAASSASGSGTAPNLTSGGTRVSGARDNRGDEQIA